MALPQISKGKLYLIVAFIIGIIATGMIISYVNQEVALKEQAMKKTVSKMQTEQAAVLVANQDIPKDTIMALNMFSSAVVPKQYIQPQAVAAADSIVNMVTAAPIAKGEQITMDKLIPVARQQRLIDAGGGLAEITPEGKRAITISVDNIAALGGMVKPQDYVDVIGQAPVPAADGSQQIVTLPLFQNVLILAVGQELAAPEASEGEGRRKKAKREFSPLITLALSPQEASLMAFVQEQSKIKLTLRSPLDTAVEPVQPGSWEALFQYLMPPKAPFPEEAAQAQVKEEPPEYVEVYRGLNKETVPLAK